MSSRRRVVLITGGGGDLGSATARAFGERDYIVVVLDNDGNRASSTADRLAHEGIHAIAHRLDVTDAMEVQALTSDLAQAYDGIDVLVNMAGIVRNAVLRKVTANDFDATMRAHVVGTLNCMQAVISPMRERAYGRIVNMSSVAIRGAVGGSSYSAAKGAIEGLSRSAAIELARHGITVNCVAPGLINAGMFLTIPQSAQEESISRIPMRRPGTPGEVAECIAFLGSPHSSYVTGQTLFVCGGVSLGY